MKQPFVRFLILTWVAASSCTRQQEQPAQQFSYPSPRYPGYVRPPKTVDDVLPNARQAVRLNWGRTPLGQVNPGERVLIFTSGKAYEEPNFIVLKALVKAFEERNIDAVFVLPAPIADVVRLTDSFGYRGYTSEKGYMEAVRWVEGWPDPMESLQWLRQRNPQLYQRFYPNGSMLENGRRTRVVTEEEGGQVGGQSSREVGYVKISPSILEELKTNPHFTTWTGDTRDFLEKYPREFHAVFFGSGGGRGNPYRYGVHGRKILGNFIFEAYPEIMSRVALFPGDIWRLVEERTIEPLAWVEEVRFNDPEGSDLKFTVTEEVAKMWAEGSYLPAHLFMFPHGMSTIRPSPMYPRLTRWLPPVVPDADGVIASTRNHTGVFPRMEVRFENSRVKEVRGGGEVGDVIRAFLDHPRLGTVVYPYHEKEAGYWYLYEGALGTNPKAFLRFDELMNGWQASERDHAGVIHWALGVGIYSDQPGKDGTRDKFFKENNVPRGHGFHMHNLLGTYRVRIRATDRWLTLIEKGRLTALDNPEVRALASRYGNPDQILQDEFVPDYPGINSPGDYQKDYAQNPWKHLVKVMKEVEEGAYPYLIR
ncbi:MAG: hypothetical protein HY645_10675 [Acidobacteria bacterium]|nr:hypothetical protein [Acidobacteriota bacterium]